MATIGQALTVPEAGWKRYDDKDSRIRYIGTWTTKTDSTEDFNTSRTLSTINGDKITFKFYGSKFRIISTRWSDSGKASVKVDGIDDGTLDCYVASPSPTNSRRILTYEKTFSGVGSHVVEIIVAEGKFVILDAIDIDDTGSLLHPILNQVSTIEDMKNGDCIPCRYTALSGAAGIFSELGTCTASEIPLAGTATPDGLFYFIMAGYDSKGRKKLIADRNIQHSISWDTLNNSGFANGVPYDFLKSMIPMLASDNDQGYVVTQSSFYSGSASYKGWKAFDKSYSDSTLHRWISDTTVSWLQVKLPTAKKYTHYSVLSLPPGASPGQAPKNWKLKGSNDGVAWVDIDTQINQTSWVVGEKRYFKVASPETYLYYRLDITADNGAGYVSITELDYLVVDELYANNNFTAALLTGGTYATDKDNDWDKIIAESTLSGLVTAANDAVWHWSNSIMSWTSSMNTTNSNRVCRGGNTTNVSNYSQVLSSSVSSVYGYRPVFLVQVLAVEKMMYLLLDNSEFKTVENNALTSKCLLSDGDDIKSQAFLSGVASPNEFIQYLSQIAAPSKKVKLLKKKVMIAQ